MVREKVYQPILRKVFVVFLFFLYLTSHNTLISYGYEDAVAKEKICLESVEGTVTIKKSNDKQIKTTEGMKLYNGYEVTTSAASYALISLDEKKLIKLDANTMIHIGQNGKKLEVLVDSGSVYFDIEEALQKDEQLNVKTSTMTLGIRGTAGTVSSFYSPNDGVRTSQSVLFTGKAKVTFHSSKEQENQHVVLTAGQVVTEWISSEKKQSSFKVDSLKQGDEAIQPFAAVEVQKNEVLQQKMKDETGFSMNQLKPYAGKELLIEQEKQRKEQSIIDEQQKKQRQEELANNPSLSAEQKGLEENDDEDDHKKDKENPSNPTPEPDQKLSEALKEFGEEFVYKEGEGITPKDFYMGEKFPNYSAKLEAPSNQGWLQNKDNSELEVSAIPMIDTVTIHNVVLTLCSKEGEEVSKKVSVVLLGQSPQNGQHMEWGQSPIFERNHKFYLEQPEGFLEDDHIILYRIRGNNGQVTEAEFYNWYMSQPFKQKLEFEKEEGFSQKIACLGEKQDDSVVDIMICKKSKPQRAELLSELYHFSMEDEKDEELQKVLDGYVDELILESVQQEEITIEDLRCSDTSSLTEGISMTLSFETESRWMEEESENVVKIRAVPADFYNIPPQIVRLTAINERTSESCSKEVAISLPYISSKDLPIYDEMEIESIGMLEEDKFFITLSGVPEEAESYFVLYQWVDEEADMSFDDIYTEYFNGENDNLSQVYRIGDGKAVFEISQGESQEEEYLCMVLLSEMELQKPYYALKSMEKITIDLEDVLKKELDKFLQEANWKELNKREKKVYASDFMKEGVALKDGVTAYLQMSYDCFYLVEKDGYLKVRAFPLHKECVVEGIRLVLEWEEKGLCMEKEVSMTLPDYYDECNDWWK